MSQGLAQSPYVASGVGLEPKTLHMHGTELTITSYNYVLQYLSIYLSIYGIYIAPLQGNYSEALPAQARAKIKV